MSTRHFLRLDCAFAYTRMRRLTSTGMAPRAVVVHHPSRGAMPVAAAQLKRSPA